MNYFTATLVILSLFSADHVLASSGSLNRIRDNNRDRDSYKGSIGSDSGPSQTDMELWESFGRWRRERGDRRDNEDRWTGDGDNRKREREREGRDRWNGDDRRGREGREGRRDHEDRDRRDRKSRDRSDRNSRDRSRPDPDYPPQPPVSRIPFPPLPIIIEPITPPHTMPSIIEPYPIETEYYESASSSVYVPTASSYTLPSVSASSASHVPSAASSYAPTLLTSAPVKTTAMVHAPRRNSSSIIYDSTVIMTTPESTVTTSVTGRYRAMSNSAAGVKVNNWAGPISFAIVLVSSILIIAIV